MSAKLDLYKTLKTEYASPAAPTFITTTPGQYFQVSGTGKPGGPEFNTAVESLYAVSYTTKMRHKKATGQDYSVAKLECVWPHIPSSRESGDWQWQLMIRVPDYISETHRVETIDALISKKKPETVRAVALVSFHEGDCVQVLHVGPYEDEPETCDLMAIYAAENGHQITGHHHEIYLSDPRRIEPARLKTILRRPVNKIT